MFLHESLYRRCWTEEKIRNVDGGPSGEVNFDYCASWKEVHIRR